MTGAIVLAAGRSERMGRPKLLLPWGRTTVLGSVLEALTGAGIEQIRVVIRGGDTALRAALGAAPVGIVENAVPGSDMLGSVRCGLRALSPDCDPILVTPADMPRLTAPLIRALIEAFRAGSGAVTERSERGLILVPVHAGRRGHPLMFAAAFREEVFSCYDGVGLRGLLEAHADRVREWPAPDGGVLEDVDTPEDYRRLRPAGSADLNQGA